MNQENVIMPLKYQGGTAEMNNKALDRAAVGARGNRRLLYRDIICRNYVVSK